MKWEIIREADKPLEIKIKDEIIKIQLIPDLERGIDVYRIIEEE